MHYRRVLIKYGGNAMINEELKEKIAIRIRDLWTHGVQVVLVHGGGPFIDKALQEAGIESEFLDGQRITTEEAFKHIEKTLKGEVNGSLVNVFNRVGLRAVGLSGKDGQIVVARKRWHRTVDNNGATVKKDIGQVGDVEAVNPHLLNLLLKEGFIPVIACIASDAEGNDYNINGDVFAGEIAAALKVDAYVVLTDVDGLFSRFPDPNSIIHQLNLAELPSYYQSIISGGMIPKMESCEAAVRAGAKKAVILNGTQPDQIKDYLMEDQLIGTTLIK